MMEMMLDVTKGAMRATRAKPDFVAAMRRRARLPSPRPVRIGSQAETEDDDQAAAGRNRRDAGAMRSATRRLLPDRAQCRRSWLRLRHLRK